MVARLLALFLFTASLLATPLWLMAQPAYACSCARLDETDAVSKADVVVWGRLMQQDVERKYTSVRMRIAADRYLKGEGPRILVVHQSGSCAAIGPVGSEYLLIARKYQGELVSSLCDGSFAVEDYARDEQEARIREVGAAAAALPEAKATPAALPSNTAENDSRPPWALPIAVATGSAALFGLAIILWRGTRRA